MDVSSVHSLDASLPCDITPPHQHEAVYLVRWYRGDDGEPLYRYWTSGTSVFKTTAAAVSTAAVFFSQHFKQ